MAEHNITHIGALARDRQAEAVLRRFARSLAPPPVIRANHALPKLARWWGVVTSVNGDETVDLSMHSADPTVATMGLAVGGSGIPYVASYAPVKGDTVMVDFVGDDPVVIGAVASMVGPPVGAMIAHTSGPANQTSYGVATTTVFTLAAPLIAGCLYEARLSLSFATQITNTSAHSDLRVTDSLGLLKPGTVYAFLGAPAVNTWGNGSNFGLITATSTATDTFTVVTQVNAASFRIEAGGVTLSIIRVG